MKLKNFTWKSNNHKSNKNNNKNNYWTKFRSIKILFKI